MSIKDELIDIVLKPRRSSGGRAEANAIVGDVLRRLAAVAGSQVPARAPYGSVIRLIEAGEL